MPGINIAFQPNEDTHLKRRNEFQSVYLDKLLQAGHNVSEINKFQDEYVKTGKLPSEYETGGTVETRTEVGQKGSDFLPFEGKSKNFGTSLVEFPITEVNVAPEVKPVGLALKSPVKPNGIPVSPEASAKFGIPFGTLVTPEQFIQLQTKLEGPKQAKVNFFRTDPKTGKPVVVESVPTQGGTDRWIDLGKGAGGASPENVKQAQLVFAKYSQMLKEGKDPRQMDPTFLQLLSEAAPLLGMGLNEIIETKDPGFWAHIVDAFGGPEAKPIEVPTGVKIPTFNPSGVNGGWETEALPPQALKALQDAAGKVVTFGNGQSWKYENGQAVRVR